MESLNNIEDNIEQEELIKKLADSLDDLDENDNFNDYSIKFFNDPVYL